MSRVGVRASKGRDGYDVGLLHPRVETGGGGRKSDCYVA